MLRPAQLRLLAAWIAITPVPLMAVPSLQMTVTDLTDVPPIVDRSVLTVQGRDLKLDAGFAGGDEPGASTIYHGGQQQLTVLLHRTRQAMIFDDRTGARIAKFLARTRQQWEAALAELPEAERELARQRLAERYPAMVPEGESSDRPIVLRRMTDTGKTNGFEWVRWEARDGDVKVREYLVTPAENIPGGRETIRVIADMSSYLQDLTRELGGQIPMQNPFLEIARLNGFPIVIREFGGGVLERETVLNSASPEKASPKAFVNPGYTVLDPIELLGDMRP